MPPAIVAAIIGAAVTGTTTGLEASGAIGGGGGGPSAADLQKMQQMQQQKQQQQQEQQAFSRFAPDVQAATGGSLSDQSFASMVAELSGSPADVNLAQQTLFGPPQGSTGLSSSSVGGQ